MCPSVNSIIQDSESISFPPAGIHGMLFPPPLSSANVSHPVHKTMVERHELNSKFF